METLDEQSWLVSSAGYELWTLKVQCSLFWAIECDWNVFFALDIEAKIRGSKSWCREQLKIHRDQFVVESLSTITIFFNLSLTSPIILRRMSKKREGIFMGSSSTSKVQRKTFIRDWKKKFMEAIDITLVEKLRAKNAKRIHQVEA